jgi:DNA primase
MMVFDADSAGVKAALRAAVLALGRGMEVKVAALPLGSDPADLILKDLEIYRKCLKSSKHIIDFYLDEITSKQKDERKLLREIRDKVLPFVKALESHIERSHFIKKIAESTEISEEAIQQDLEKVESAVFNQEAGEKSVIEERGKGSALEMALAFFLWQKSEKEPKIVVKDFGSALDKIAGNITGLIAKNERATELAFKAEQYYKGKSNLDSDAKELLLNAEEEVLKKRLSLAMKDLHNAEKSGDEKTLKKALSLCQELSRKLDDLKKQRANYS